MEIFLNQKYSKDKIFMISTMSILILYKHWDNFLAYEALSICKWRQHLRTRVEVKFIKF